MPQAGDRSSPLGVLQRSTLNSQLDFSGSVAAARGIEPRRGYHPESHATLPCLTEDSGTRGRPGFLTIGYLNPPTPAPQALRFTARRLPAIRNPRGQSLPLNSTSMTVIYAASRLSPPNRPPKERPHSFRPILTIA